MITIILSIGILLIISLFIFIKTKKDNTEFPTISPIVQNKKYLYNDTYVDQCPPDKLYNDGQVCVSECPSTRPFVIGTSCTSSCGEVNKYLENEKICLPSCFPKYINNNTNKCVESCSKYSDDFLRICYDEVPDGKFSFENKIVTKCPSYYNNKRECGFPKDVEFLNGITAGTNGEYISLIGKKNDKYNAYIFDHLEWYEFEIVGAMREPFIISSGDGRVQLIKIPIDNSKIKCVISKDYGKNFKDLEFSYYLNDNINSGYNTTIDVFKDIDLSYDGKFISVISEKKISLFSFINVIILDTYTNNVRYFKSNIGQVNKILITNYASNIGILFNDSINNVKYIFLDSNLTETFNFNADIFYKPDYDWYGGNSSACKSPCMMWRSESWGLRFNETRTPAIGPKSSFALSYSDGINRDIIPVNPNQVGNNNINNYNIVKNNDVLFIIDNNKQLYTYNLLIGDNIIYKTLYNQKDLNYMLNPRIFTGKTNDSVYILDQGNNNKIYKVTLENEISVNPISTSLSLIYRHISSNLESQQYILSIGDNKVYISDDYGQNWKQMK